MSKQYHERLAKFDALLDTLLSSERARQQALDSSIPILVTASKIIGMQHPQLSSLSKQRLRRRILAHHKSLQTQPLFDEAKTAEVLFNAPHPSLSADSRADILEHVLTSQQTALSGTSKRNMYQKVQIAQQTRQLDKMLESDEAFAIAQTNPDPLIQAAVALVSTPAPALSRSARAKIKQHLIPAAPVKKKPVLRPAFAHWRHVAASVAVLMFMMLAALPVAAQDALPGDPLYTVKRGVERARIIVTPSDSGRAQLYLNFASERIEEANLLMNRGIYDEDLLETAVLNLELSSEFATNSNNNRVINQLNTVESSLEVLITDLQSAELIDDATANSYRTPDDDIVINEITPEPTTAPSTNDNSDSIAPASIIIEGNTLPDVTEGTAEETITNIIPDANPVYVNTNGRVNVRSQPTSSSMIVTQITANDTVIQLGTNENSTWYRIELVSTGEQGWVASMLLSDTPEEAEQVRNSRAQQANGNNSNNGNANGNNSNNGNANGNNSNNGDNGIVNGQRDSNNGDNGTVNGQRDGNNGDNGTINGQRGGNNSP